jgi:hypothetical protein
LLTFDELLESILRDLGIAAPGTGRVAMIDKLNEFLLEKARTGHIVSVLIDEAQHLTEDALEGVRLLSNMETDRDKLIQIILVGQPELEVKLNRPSLRQLKQRVSLWSRLDSLSPADTESYIRHRLTVAGYQGRDVFDSASIKLINEHAAGTPRLINSICDNALLTAFALSQKTVTAEIIEEVIRDLRLARESDAAGFGLPERNGTVQFPPKALRTAAEAGDARGRVRGRSQEESLERVRMSRASRVVGGPDVVQNLGFKLDDPPVRALHERDLRRPAKSLWKGRRGGEELAEADDNSGFDADSPDRDAFVSPHGTARQRPMDTIISPAFFAQMARSLADAMGPMASLVLKERIASLGESVEAFPIVRLPELVAAIKQEILSEALRLRFEKEVAEQIQQHSQFVAWRSSAK